jgi:hypothetical protein
MTTKADNLHEDVSKFIIIFLWVLIIARNNVDKSRENQNKQGRAGKFTEDNKVLGPYILDF